VQLVLTGILRLFSSSLQFAPPILIRRILRLLEGGELLIVVVVVVVVVVAIMVMEWKMDEFDSPFFKGLPLVLALVHFAGINHHLFLIPPPSPPPPIIRQVQDWMRS